MFILAKLLQALHSDAGPWSLAFGVVLGMIFGLTPLLNVHNLLVLFAVLFLRVNLSTFLLSWGIFSALAYGFDPLMMQLGENILTSQALNGVWTSVYNTQLGRLSQFHNTLVMGSIAVSLLLAPLVLFLSRYLILEYRDHILSRAEKWRILQVVKGSRVYQLYQRMGG